MLKYVFFQYEPERRPRGVYSLKQFPKFSFELVRNDLSSSVGAALGNALLRDCSDLFKDPEIVEHITLDRGKLDRQKQKVKVLASEKSDEVQSLVCVGVDGKTDKTLVMSEYEENGEKYIKKAMEKENHMTVTVESGEKSGQYLTHTNIPVVGATGTLHAAELYRVLEQYDSLESIQGILLDNTSVNTGHKTGLVVELEKLLKRRLHTVGCNLHQNELPFRAVFKNMDGTTKSPNHFSGPMGKQAEKNHDTEKLEAFKVIDSPVKDMEFTEEVIADLSSDQRLLYEHTIGISSGEMNVRFAHRTIGPVNHARWLTLAIRLQSAYIHTENPSENLIKLVTYIQQVYSPCWFLHKRSNKLHEAPAIMLYMIKQMRAQTAEIQEISIKNLKNNAFCLLPENIIYCMLLDDDEEVRALALHRILQIRESPPSNRINRILPINKDAEKYFDLVDINRPDIAEPPTTVRYTDLELKEMLENRTKPSLPIFPSHSQSVERAVKLVSEASVCVYGQERRHQHICGKVLSRNLRKSFASKSYYEETYDDIL